MRRRDIELGVEYAETAPLAFGREPNRRPYRVKFTSTDPGPWAIIRTARYTGTKWEQVEGRVVRESDVPATVFRTLREATLRAYGYEMPVEYRTISGTTRAGTSWRMPKDGVPEGGTVTYYEPYPGSLPAERWVDGRWQAGLVAPAAVHRRWAEIQQKRDIKLAALAELDDAANVPQINELLRVVGLDGILTAERRSFSTSVVLEPVTADGSQLLIALTEWAGSKGLIARIVT